MDNQTGWEHRIDTEEQFKRYELPILWMMKLFGWHGFVSFWGVVYYRGSPSEEPVVHEYHHTLQRDVYAWRYDFIYFYDFIKNLIKYREIYKAYRQIPFEIEARAVFGLGELKVEKRMDSWRLVGDGIHVKLS